MILTGLRNNNLQAYLAALGVLRLLPGAALGWDLDGTGCARLDGIDDPLAALKASLVAAADPYRSLMWLTQKTDQSHELKALRKQRDATKQTDGQDAKDALKQINARIKAIEDRPAAESFAAHQRANADDGWAQDPEHRLWLQALWTPAGEPTQLDMMRQGNRPGGLMKTLAASRAIVRARPEAKLQEALLGPWRHEDKVGSLYLEFESIGYAARHRGENSPADSAPRAVAAAQWLAGEGLPVLGSVAKKDGLRLPLWRRAEPLAVVAERLKHHIGEQWLLVAVEKLPGKKGKYYWTARTPSTAKIPAGSRKKNGPKYRDLYNGSEIWMV